jgi:7-carboxy-7-deazaguanine synthase
MVSEIFHSIQGESTYSGRPCVFVRLTGCHLRCDYCDTEYAFHGGARRTVGEVVEQVEAYGCDLVEVTGGEPLLQANVHPLMTALCDRGLTVLVETSGSLDISRCDPRVVRIMDLKTPDSGAGDANAWSNIAHLTARDEVKFVLCSRRDYEWARQVIVEHDLSRRVGAVLLSAVAAVEPGLEIRGISEGLSLRDLARWVLADGLPVRIQTQLHKLIWEPTARGV